MANRYWVGNGGSWQSTTQWSTTSGGTSGAAVPSSSDDVFFDTNSFTLTGQTVTANGSGGFIFCNSMDWTNVSNNPIFGAGTATSIIIGSGFAKSGTLIFSSSMSHGYNGGFSFSCPNAITANIDLGGQAL